MCGLPPLTPHTMDNHQHQALTTMFYARRLDPSNSEHAMFIKAEIAKLEVLDPHDSESFKTFYDEKTKQYLASQQATEQDEKDQEANRKAETLKELQARSGIEAPLPELKEEKLEIVEVKEEVKEVKKKIKPSKKSSPK